MTPDDFLFSMVPPGTVAPDQTLCCTRQTTKGAQPAFRYNWGGGAESYTHFSVGLFDTQGTGQFYRRNVTWKGAFILVLDDVFEKATPPTLTPTYRLETKPGSEQWGYLFDRHLTDPSEFESLVESCIKAGLTDPDMKGRIRLARLPGTDPKGRGFPARIVWADWSRRFDPHRMTEALGIRYVRMKASDPRRIRSVGWTPQADPLADLLYRNNWVLGRPMGAWLPIICPFVEKHTGGDMSGTRYRVPDANDIQRRIKCHHSSCTHLRTDDYLDEFNRLGFPRFWRIAADLLPKVTTWN